MSDTSRASLVEEWQTGALLVIGSVVVGVILATIGGSVSGQFGAISGFILGPILAFLAFSYLLYGR